MHFRDHMKRIAAIVGWPCWALTLALVMGCQTSTRTQEKNDQINAAFVAPPPSPPTPILDDYTRSPDPRQASLVEQNVTSALREDERLANDRIDVKVKGQSIALLTGQVKTEQDRLHAQKVASQVAGVRGVDNQLQVKDGESQQAGQQG